MMIATQRDGFHCEQVAILKRHTSNVIVNFDPDGVWRECRGKSRSASLTEEGLATGLVTS